MSSKATAANVARSDAEPEGRGAHQAPALVAGVDDATVVHLDPADEAVGEAEAVGGSEGFEVLDHIGWRIVVVGEPGAEDRLVQAGHRFGRDPAEAGDARFDPVMTSP